MKEETRSVGVSSEKSPADVYILTVKRATEESCTQEKSKLAEYLRSISADGTDRLLIRRYLEVMKAVRPELSSGEVLLVLEALSPSWGMLTYPADELRQTIAMEIADWASFYPGFVPKGVVLSDLLGRMERMSFIELCSIVTSAHQWRKSPIEDLTRESLGAFFNLSPEGEEVTNG